MPLPSWWRGLGLAAIDLVYPPQCPGCGSIGGQSRRTIETGHPALCEACRAELRPCGAPRCEICGEGFSPADTRNFVCQTCAGQSFAFDFALAPFQSRGVLRDLIHRFKYQRQLFLRPLLGDLLLPVLEEPRLRALGAEWLTVPVPLHPRRFREREFNQAEELCRELQKRRGIACVNALRRIRYTSSQTRYRRDVRRANLRGAFVARRWRANRWRDRAVVLVDDVFTTGSTAHECARVLRAAGAKKVVVITLARG